MQSLAALSTAFICVVIGLPIWWKTTEVYRVQLPYYDILAFDDIKVEEAVHFRVVSFSNSVNLQELQTLLGSSADVTDIKDSKLSFQYIGALSQMSADERHIFKHASNIKEIDAQLQQLDQNANYTVYILPADDLRLQGTGVIGTGRAVFVPHTTDSTGNLVKWIQNILKDVFIQEDAVYKTLQSTYGNKIKKADKELMRSLRSSPGYELTFTLLNPQPNRISVTWDIERSVKMYLDPMLSLFSEFANITVKSQHLHYTGLGVRAEKTNNGSRLSNDQLPHIINPIEAYLGSYVSNNPNINFLVYIPTRDQSPLNIYDSAGKLSTTNAFLSPRWGGLMIYNVALKPEEGVTQLPISVEIDMKRVLSVFITQLRLILGIPTMVSDDQLQVLQPASKVIADWQLDQWLRKRCIENVFTSTATLRSLAELLDRISNVVINDEVGALVIASVESIQKSIDLLASGHLKEAYLVARQAREASEKAFFDPSLLELLYFPEDQKFAIYIPLFLPVGFPIVLSLVEALKWLRGKETTEKSKRD